MQTVGEESEIMRHAIHIAMTYDEIQVERIKTLRSEEEKKGKIYLNGLFTDESMELVFMELERLENDRTIDEVNLIINSNGGLTTALFALVDQMERMKKPVSTFVMGKAYSAGAILLIAGTGKRTASKRSEILLHEVASDSGYAKTTQRTLDAQRLIRINEKLKGIIKARTKMKAKDVEMFMQSNTDRFISAVEALEYGIVDAIV